MKDGDGAQRMSISVIVPVYNVEPYLRRCVDSLLAQTYDDFEILLINDGSTDGSAGICDYYGANKSRVRVFHQENKGVSAARNLGLAEAHGLYVSFVDADDWVEPGFLQAFVDILEHQRDTESYEQQPIDMVMQGYVNHQGEIVHMPSNSYYHKELFGAPLTEAKEKKLIGSTCNKVYSMSIIKDFGIYFNTNVSIGEDTLFNMAFISHMNSFAITSQALYHYIDTGAKSYSIDANGFLNRIKSFDDIFSNIHFFSEREKQLFQSKEFQMSVYVVRLIYHDMMPRGKRMELLKNMRRKGKNNREIRMADYNFSSRMIAQMVLHLPTSICDVLFIGMRYVRNLL